MGWMDSLSSGVSKSRHKAILLVAYAQSRVTQAEEDRLCYKMTNTRAPRKGELKSNQCVITVCNLTEFAAKIVAECVWKHPKRGCLSDSRDKEISLVKELF